MTVQRLLSRRADRLKRRQAVWQEAESWPAGAEAAPLQVVREALTTQQEVFRRLTLSAREEALQLSDADLDMQQRREANRRTQLVLLQLEELAGDFERTLALKQRAEEELQALAQEAERQRSRPEPQPGAGGRPGVPEEIRLNPHRRLRKSQRQRSTNYGPNNSLGTVSVEIEVATPFTSEGDNNICLYFQFS